MSGIEIEGGGGRVIDSLSAASALADGDVLEILQGGSYKKAHISLLNPSVSNVQFYGATGDGSTDDPAAIQAAIDAAATAKGVCFLPVPSVAYMISKIGRAQV